MTGAVPLVGFYIATFAVMGAYMAFWPVWLESRGLTKAEIGQVMAAGIFVRAASPWLVQWVERRGSPRQAALLLSTGGLAVFTLFAVAENYWALLALCAVFGGTFWQLFPLTDSIASQVARERYGRLRLFGSGSWMLSTVLAGWLLDGRGTHTVFWLVLVAVVVSMAVATRLPVPNSDPEPAETSTRSPVADLLRDRRFLAMAVGAGMIQASHAGLYSFGSLHWSSIGLSTSTIGWLWAVGPTAEIVLFHFSARFVARWHPVWFGVAGGAAAILRWTIMANAESTPVFVVAQLLHAFTFGATHLAIVNYIRRELPARYAATAQATYVAVGTGAGMGIATLSAGALFESQGAAMFWAMGIVAITGILCLTQARPPRNREFRTEDRL